MTDADEMRVHFSIPEADRGAKWRHRFYDLLETVRFTRRDPDVFEGPDGFPYLALDFPALEDDGEVSVIDLLENATDEGFGIAIAPALESAAWVLTCGDLVTRREFGGFEFPRIGITASDMPTFRAVLKETQHMEVLAPTDAMLPVYVRPLLADYFQRALGIEQPGVLAIISPDQEPREQLVFRVAREDFDDDDDFQAAIAGLTWYLPRHMVVSILPDEVVEALGTQFIPLAA